MKMMLAAETPQLIDPLAVADVFATGCEAPEFGNGTVRITCYADHARPVAERVVIARLVFSTEGFFAAFENLAAAIGGRH